MQNQITLTTSPELRRILQCFCTRALWQISAGSYSDPVPIAGGLWDYLSPCRLHEVALLINIQGPKHIQTIRCPIRINLIHLILIITAFLFVCIIIFFFIFLLFIFPLHITFSWNITTVI